ncbi:MAG: hypothetical protein EOO99_11935 [Pedobacter sp.]|nr:MAG: hypothetical protein EOO99_11935 [Pedobacter sp.]
MNNEEKLLELEFQNALLLRNFEIDLFWKRAWFYGALLIGISVAYYELKKTTQPIVPVVCLSFIATLIALSQSLISRGSKYWQERWEYITKNRESALKIELTKNRQFEKEHEQYYIHAAILEKGENILTRSHRFSVSKLTFLICDLISICFFLVWIIDTFEILPINKQVDWSFTGKISIFYISIFTYLILFWRKGKVVGKETLSRKKNLDYERLREDYIANKVSEL